MFYNGFCNGFSLLCFEELLTHKKHLFFRYLRPKWCLKVHTCMAPLNGNYGTTDPLFYWGSRSKNWPFLWDIINIMVPYVNNIPALFLNNPLIKLHFLAGTNFVSTLLYIYDLQNSLKFAKSSRFTADTCLTYSNKNPKTLETNPNYDLKDLTLWLRAKVNL